MAATAAASESRLKSVGLEVEREEEGAAASSAESSGVFEDLHAPLLKTPPGGSLRRRSLAARLRRLSRLSASGSADCSSPENHRTSCGNETVIPSVVSRPPTKGILRRQKVHCCSSTGHRGLSSATSFSGGTESSDGSPERRPMSPGRFCKRALGRVFGLDVSRHRADGVASVVDEEQEEQVISSREPKVVSIAEPLKKPSSRRQSGDAWHHRSATNRPRKPPLVFGGTFPIDEPVGVRGAKSPFQSIVKGSVDVATFPVDAFCCAAPNLCQGHAQHHLADSSLHSTHTTAKSSSVASTSESEPESRAGPLRLYKHGRPPSNSSVVAKIGASLTQPKWKGSSFLYFLSGDSKVHKS